ncbi:MAG: hypothetical protein PVJ15_01980 [Gammaproteobacteria bacterium]|jgi:hypothetical protein
MKTSTRLNISEKTISLVDRIVVGSLLGTVLAPLAMAADVDDGFQYNALFNPGPSQLSAEARGRVMIYDGLGNDVVEHALDTQFHRIEHMRFVRTRETRPDGEVLVEDDGC